MLNEWSLVDRIERAHNARPSCDCGRKTTTIYRDGAMWLECAIVTKPISTRAHRLWAAVTDPAHVHEKIVKVPAPGRLAA